MFLSLAFTQFFQVINLFQLWEHLVTLTFISKITEELIKIFLLKTLIMTLNLEILLLKAKFILSNLNHKFPNYM